MDRTKSLLVWLTVATTAVAQPSPAQPILVLNADWHTSTLRKVLFTPDGRQLLSVSHDKTVRVWDVKSGELVQVIRPPIGRGHDGMLAAAALSPDGRLLAVGGLHEDEEHEHDEKPGAKAPALRPGPDEHVSQEVYLVDLKTNRIVRVLRKHTNGIRSLAFSRDGRKLASGGEDAKALIWDVATGREERVLIGHKQPVSGLAFSPNGRLLVTTAPGERPRLWSVATGRFAELPGHDVGPAEVGAHCVAWSPDGETFATGGFDRQVLLWEAVGKLRKNIPLKAQVTSLTYTADSGRLLVTHGIGQTKVCALLDLTSGEETARFDRHTNTIRDGALSPDGKLAATAGALSGELFLWRTDNGAVVHHLGGDGRSVWGAGWSADGRTIAWGNTRRQSQNDLAPLQRTFNLDKLEFGDAPEDNFVRARTADQGLTLSRFDDRSVSVRRGNREVARLTLKEEKDRVRCFTLVPGNRVAIGCDLGMHLFDATTGAEMRGVHDFEAHVSTVWDLVPSPDGRHILSASNDQTLRIWDPKGEEPLLSLFFAGNEWIAWTPEGYYAASAGGERLMGWQVNNGRDALGSFFPAVQFRKSLYRPDVINRVVAEGSVVKAVAAADRERSRQSEPANLPKLLPPRVTAVSAREVNRAGERMIEVKATAEGAGEPVTALRLLLDGRPYAGADGHQKFTPPQTKASASWAVPLSGAAGGATRAAVRADSKVSHAISAEVPVIRLGKGAKDATELPALYVLAVGVSAYASPGLKLKFAARDAEALAGVLEGKSGRVFRKVEKRLLTDGQATRKEVLLGLEWLRQQMTQRDVGVVFYAGHGAKDAANRFYLLPVDADPTSLLATAVPEDDLKQTLSSTPGRLLALLDTCHAGAVGGDKRRAVALTDDLIRDLVTDDYGVIVMCASMGREFAIESNELKHGLFTKALVEGLDGKADSDKDGTVYLHELDHYVTDRVKELSKGSQHPVTAKPTSIRSFPLSRP